MSENSHPVPESSVPDPSGPAEYAVRATTRTGDKTWFTIGQAWSFDYDGETAYRLQLTMTPTSWDGALVLMPISPQVADQSTAD